MLPLHSLEDGYQYSGGMCCIHLQGPRQKQSSHKTNMWSTFQWKLSTIYRTPATYPRDHTSNLMLCLLKTRWQARELRWIASLKVALYTGLLVSFINDVRSFGGSSCMRHIMIGKMAIRHFWAILGRPYWKSWALRKYEQMPNNIMMYNIWQLVPSVVSRQNENHIACPHHVVRFQCTLMAGKGHVVSATSSDRISC
jgi:hypothetical protein